MARQVRRVEGDLIANFLHSLSANLSERRKQQRTQADRMALLEAEASTRQRGNLEESLFRHQLEQQEPEQQIKQRLFELTGATPLPTPSGGYNRMEQERGIPEEVATAHRNREVQALLQMLGRGSSGTVSPIVFDQNTGQYRDSAGNVVTSVPRGTPVRNAPFTMDTLRNRSQAESEGRAAGTPLTPQQEAFEANFDSLLNSVKRAEGLLSSEGSGFKKELFATGIPFQPGAGELAFELQNAADVLLRLRSGAQINEREFTRLRGLLPRGRDAISELLGNPGLARKKLAKFYSEFDAIRGQARNRLGQRMMTEQPGSSRTSSEDDPLGLR